LVVESRFTVDNIEEQGSYMLYFSPLRDAPGHSYAWELAADGDASTGLGLCQDGEGRAALSVYGVDWAQVYGDEIFIAERQAPLPRAYVVYSTEVISDSTQAIARLLDEQFDLRNMAVTAVDVGLPLTTTLPADPATIIEYHQTKIVLEGTAASAGLLILGDGYHPGWQATLNGEAVPVIKANYVQRGVVLPPGPYQVVIYFAPAALRNGTIASVLGLLLFAFIWVVDHRYFRGRGQFD
jgi:hypothetical protein